MSQDLPAADIRALRRGVASSVAASGGCALSEQSTAKHRMQEDDSSSHVALLG